MQKVLAILMITLGSIGSTVFGASITLAEWSSFTADGKSTIGELTVGGYPSGGQNTGTIADGKLVLNNKDQRNWINISSLGLNLKKDTFTISMDVTNLQVGNGPMFSMTSGEANSQTTAFGNSISQGKWSASANGGSMGVNSGVAYTDNLSGTVSVTFVYDEKTQKNSIIATITTDGITTELLNSEITYSSASSADSNLNYLVLGGWGSTSGNGSSMTINSLSISKQIPEPSTATLGLLGLGALMLRRRRQA